MGITQKQIVYQYHRDHTTPNGEPCDGGFSRAVVEGADVPPLVVSDACLGCLAVVEMDRREPVPVVIGIGSVGEVLSHLYRK
jgi:hypothetical protein